jgi:catechol 2,3-dioxygenase-like lactoylglutathione lyase family enzyme
MASTPSTPSTLTHVLETCLYVKSMTDARSFYRDILGLTPSMESERISVFPLGHTTLILFQLGLTNDDIHPNGNAEYTLPKHGPTPVLLQVLQAAGEKTEDLKALRQHYCLAVPDRRDVHLWEDHFKSHQVNVLGVMDWERGGRSVYFADPDGNVGEIASRGLWPHY